MFVKKKTNIKFNTGKTINFSEMESNCIEFMCYGYSIELIASLLKQSISDVLKMSESICKRVGVKNTLLLKKAIFQSDFSQILLDRMKTGASALVTCHQNNS